MGLVRQLRWARIPAVFGAAVVAALAGSGCDGAAVAVGPSAAPARSDQIVSAAVAPSKPAFVVYGCAVGGVFSPAIDFTVTAWKPIDLDQVTIQLMDGSHVGGPMIPFPSASLHSLFGSVHVGAGTTRVFTFHPETRCGASAPRFVSAAFGYWDPSGAHHDGIAQAPWTGGF